MTNTETITLSKAEYEALLQDKEDLEDLVAVMEADRSDALIPHDIAVAIVRGGNPITVFRNYKGLSLRELARRAGISAGYLSEIEGGTKAGSAAVLARIAREVGTAIDALMVDDACNSANWDKPKKFERGVSEYREMFETMGIEARELGHVLRYGGLPRRVYFNRNKDVGIYFSAHGDDEAWYPSNLWEKIDPYRVQKADHKRLNVVPRPGMATRAFWNLVLNWEKHEGQ